MAAGRWERSIQRMKKSYEIDMCNGPLLGKILVFSIPLMLSGILQLLFNAADIIVVGRFAGSTALAAVGSTASLINLMINVFVGLSVGVNVFSSQILWRTERKRYPGYGTHSDHDGYIKRSVPGSSWRKCFKAYAHTHGNTG